jgi:hypothetical protein
LNYYYYPYTITSAFAVMNSWWQDDNAHQLNGLIHLL